MMTADDVGTALWLAGGSLRGNVMGSFLTTLGITVAIAAVICTVAPGESSAEQAPAAAARDG